MTPPFPRAVRTGAILFALLGALGIALVAPLPAVPDTERDAVRQEVAQRLPGWRIERVDPSWEGAHTVVAVCAGRQIGFQFVPGHGLPAHDAWLQPSDDFSRERLAQVSDHWRYLIWYADPAIADSLSCAEELARHDAEPILLSVFD